jgi:subtilisin family serine protease
MKAVKLTSLFLAGAVGLAACSDDSTKSITGADLNAPAFSAQANNDAQPTGRHLVVFSSNNKAPADFGQRVAGLGGSVVSEYGKIGVAVVSGLSDEAAAQLQAFDDTQIVEHDLEVQYIDPQADVQLLAAEDMVASPTDPTTASFYPRQWHLRAIGAEQAWAAGRLGSSSVTVAILDTGIDILHPDLQGRVDMVRSASFVPSDDQLVRDNFPGAPLWTDLHYHGTHVGATVSSNGIVAAGVTSQVTLMAVKVLSASGRGASSGILAGIMHAADNGADVANMSLGGTFRKSLNPGYVSVINRAFNYANRMGMTIVVSAGNDNYDMDSDSDIYKTYCMATHVICTSATGPTSSTTINGPWQNIDAKATYSNFGSHISVAAPGGNTGGAVIAACSKTTILPGFAVCRDPNRHFVLNARGTSMASPHASGLAALLVEQVGKNRPSQVANRMAQSADDLGDAGRDVIYGRGRINVAKALGL